MKSEVDLPKRVRGGSRPIRVAAIDGQPLFREGIAQALGGVGHITLTAEGSSLAEADRIAGKGLADVMLLEPDNIAQGGLAAACELARRHPQTRIVLMTDRESVNHVMKALDGGIRGYIHKSTEPSELVRIIDMIGRGEKFITPWLGAQMRAARTERRADPARLLSPRETQILDLVGQGLSNKEVANVLRISDKTVKHYMTGIFEKLQVRNRLEAVLKARERGRTTMRDLAAAD